MNLTFLDQSIDSQTKCIHACKFTSENKIELPKLSSSLTAAFGAGVEFSMIPFSVDISTEHTWNKSMSNKKSTEVTVTLGDENPGDEIVVDLSYDKTYGTISFLRLGIQTYSGIP